MSNHDIDVSNNEPESRFEVSANGAVAVVSYTLEPGRIVFTHTHVPGELSGRGIANQLARAGLEHARANDLKVVVHCSFIAKYIERNPEYRDLLDS